MRRNGTVPVHESGRMIRQDAPLCDVPEFPVDDLQRFVLAPFSLSVDGRHQIEAHLELCKICRIWVDTYPLAG